MVGEVASSVVESGAEGEKEALTDEPNRVAGVEKSEEQCADSRIAGFSQDFAWSLDSELLNDNPVAEQNCEKPSKSRILAN